MHPSTRSPLTLAEHGALKLFDLCHALGRDAYAERFVELWRDTLGGSGARSRDAAPAWPSDVCDDHGPFEFSLSINEHETSLRALVETADEDGSLAARGAAGWRATRRLADRLGLALDRLEAVEELFTSAAPRGSFARWHAIELRESGAFEVKVYLNPRVRGDADSRAVVEETLARLGHSSAPLETMLRRGDLDTITYVSLDLASHPSARVKVYVAHRDATCSDLEAALASCRDHAPGAVTRFCRELVGHNGPYVEKALSTTASWTEAEELPSGTLHLPIRGFVRDDAVACDRVHGCLHSHRIPLAGYERVVAAFTKRPLVEGVGMITYASLKTAGSLANIAVYFSPETYRVFPPREEVPS